MDPAEKPVLVQIIKDGQILEVHPNNTVFMIANGWAILRKPDPPQPPVPPSPFVTSP